MSTRTGDPAIEEEEEEEDLTCHGSEGGMRWIQRMTQLTTQLGGSLTIGANAIENITEVSIARMTAEWDIHDRE